MVVSRHVTKIEKLAVVVIQVAAPAVIEKVTVLVKVIIGNVVIESVKNVDVKQ